MKAQFIPRKARAVAPLLCATALLTTPAFAQETAPQTAPAPQAQPSAPPAIVTPPRSATVDIPPVVATVPEGQAQADSAEAETGAKPAAHRAPARAERAARPSPRHTAASAPAEPVRPAPAASAAAEPDANTSPAAPADTRTGDASPPAAPAETAAPVSGGQSQDSNTTRTEAVAGVPPWAWIAGGVVALLVILGGLIAATRRRREASYEEVYVEETPVEPTPVAEPVAVAPATPAVVPAPRKEPEYERRAAPVSEAETAVAAPAAVEIGNVADEDVAALTADAPVSDRPWLEFAMRPVRAGTNVDEAVVEIELTVGNAGSVPAKDVRISTFLLSGDPSGSEMERVLIDPPAEAAADPVTIAPGEGKRIDATLALLKSQMGETLPDAIRPVVVADARYTLPDGSEGRTSASFVVGVSPEGGGALEPIELARAAMHDNVAVELNGAPHHV